MKEKVKIEYIFAKVSVNALWNMVGTPVGLAKWFCDSCEREDNTFRFEWQRSTQDAECLKEIDGNLIRFRWDDEDHPRAFFEFKLTKNDLTRDVTLEITDFASMDDEDDCVDLWNTQVESLRRVLGA